MRHEDNTIRHRKQKMVPYTHPSTLQTDKSLEDTAGDLQTSGKAPPNTEDQRLVELKNDGYLFITVPNGNLSAQPSQSRGTAEEEETTFIERDDYTQPLLEDEGGGGGGRDSESIPILIEDSNETSLSICLQVTLPYIIAGFGMVLAGMVLDKVQHTPVFTNVTEIFILVPSLLGLKGNLEMTLASRLSTQANLGNMDTRKEQFKMIGGNLALIQMTVSTVYLSLFLGLLAMFIHLTQYATVQILGQQRSREAKVMIKAQAIVVGFLASMVAMIMGWIPEGNFNIDHALLLCASSMCTASVASFLLGSIMVAVVMGSRKCNINPDNVATPIAAALGDLITLLLLSGVCILLYNGIQGDQKWLSPTLIAVFILLIPLWVYISVHNKYTNDVIYSGWVPVLSAMAISSVGGMILDFTVANYKGIAVYQPVINGVGGNLVAVQASRISTSLHKVSRPGILPQNAVHGCPNCPSAFFGKNVNARAARVLIALVIPGHLIFMYTIAFMKAGHTTATPIFAVMYLTAALLQVVILLYIANWMVHLIWRMGEDPDNSAIPYLTALGDLLGTAFLAAAFHILYLIGDKDADKPKCQRLKYCRLT